MLTIFEYLKLEKSKLIHQSLNIFQEWHSLRTSCCKVWFPDVSDRIADPGLLVAFRACRDHHFGRDSD